MPKHNIFSNGEALDLVNILEDYEPTPQEVRAMSINLFSKIATLENQIVNLTSMDIAPDIEGGP